MDGNAESLRRHGSRLVNGLMVATSNGVKPFVLQRRRARLEFAQPEYEGMFIETRLDVDIRTFFELQALASDDSGTGNMKAAFEMFGSQILEAWNIQDEDGTTLPADAVGFMALPPTLGTAILGAWSEAVTSAGEASASK